MSDDRRAQAGAEAGRRFPDGANLMRGQDRLVFMQGVEWADTNPQPTTITEAEFEDAYTYWFDGLPSRERALEFLWALGVKVLDTDAEA